MKNKWQSKQEREICNHADIRYNQVSKSPKDKYNDLEYGD
jgi:hypothetical protein